MRFTRTFVVGLTSVALAVGGARTTATAAPTAPAAPAAPAQAAFSNGKAKAVATVFGAAPGVGNLALGTGGGVAVAELTNRLAQAQSKVLDLGLIGTTLTAEQCDGSPGALRQDQLPQAVTVDNRSGDASSSSDYAPIVGSSLGGGRQAASATTGPGSHAEVTAVSSAFEPLVKLAGASSTADTRVIDNKAREAEAIATMDIDIAGVVKLSGLRWRAHHRSGDSPDVTGTFEIASGTAGSVPLPVDQLGPLQDAINAALAPSGVTVELPHVEHLTTPNELLRVTPLLITLRDSPLGKTVLGPGLNLTRQQREQLYSSIAAVTCQLAGALLVGDITLDVASGTGFLTIALGGVEATSGDSVEGNPFGDVPPFSSLPPAVTAGATFSPSTGGSFASGVAAPAAAPAAAAAPAPKAALGPIDHVCVTLHLSARPGCSNGRGWPIGVAGIALTAGMAFLDWKRQQAAAAALDAAEAVA